MRGYGDPAGPERWKEEVEGLCFGEGKRSIPQEVAGFLPSYAVPLASKAVLPPNYTLLIFQPQPTRQPLCPAFPAPPSPQTRPRSCCCRHAPTAREKRLPCALSTWGCSHLFTCCLSPCITSSKELSVSLRRPQGDTRETANTHRRSMIKAKIRDGDGEWDGVGAPGREAALSTSDWFPKSSLALPGPSAPGVSAKPAWRRAVLPSSRTHNACAHTQPPFPNTHAHTLSHWPWLLDLWHPSAPLQSCSAAELSKWLCKKHMRAWPRRPTGMVHGAKAVR